MTEQGSKQYPIEEALRAQKALRDKAGLPPEQFPVDAFVGMKAASEANGQLVESIDSTYMSPTQFSPQRVG